jgi:hypothetical protein
MRVSVYERLELTPSMTRWLALAGFIILIYCSFLSAVYVTSSVEEIAVGPGAIVPFITGIVATASIAMALKTAKSEVRRSWELLLVGIAMWTLADLIWGVQEIWSLTQEVYFSFADFMWIAGYVPIAMAIWFYLPTLGPLLRDVRKVIVLIVICAVPLLIFVYHLGSVLSSPELKVNGWTAFVPVLYPILDTFIAGGGLLIAMYSRRQTRRWPWFLIGGALVLWSYSDVWYAFAALMDWYSTDVLIRLSVDLTYTLAYLLLAVGGTLALQSDIFTFVKDEEAY